MAELIAKKTEKALRRPVDKFTERRKHLADAALRTLAELGYARTSLRDIAQHSEFSHGVLHYYFTDKADLITHCVRQYKTQCVTRYDQIMAESSTAPQLRRELGLSMKASLTEDGSMHRLWYDLRSQSLFEPSFRDDVREIDQSLERMIWRIITTYAELAHTQVTVTSPTAYAIFDGLFQQALLKQLSGVELAGDELASAVCDVLPRLTSTMETSQPARTFSA